MKRFKRRLAFISSLAENLMHHTRKKRANAWHAVASHGLTQGVTLNSIPSLAVPALALSAMLRYCRL
jgi:hypothetical protein